MKLFVANFPFRFTEDDLTELFATFGKVDSVTITTDKETGRSKGYGFVEMPDDYRAVVALKCLDGSLIDDRTIKVTVAYEKPPRRDRPRGGQRPHSGQRPPYDRRDRERGGYRNRNHDKS